MSGWFVVRNRAREFGSWLRLEGLFEYPRWVYDQEQATPMPMWKAYLLAEQLLPFGQATPLDVVRVQ